MIFKSKEDSKKEYIVTRLDATKCADFVGSLLFGYKKEESQTILLDQMNSDLFGQEIDDVVMEAFCAFENNSLIPDISKWTTKQIYNLFLLSKTFSVDELGKVCLKADHFKIIQIEKKREEDENLFFDETERVERSVKKKQKTVLSEGVLFTSKAAIKEIPNQIESYEFLHVEMDVADVTEATIKILQALTKLNTLVLISKKPFEMSPTQTKTWVSNLKTLKNVTLDITPWEQITNKQLGSLGELQVVSLDLYNFHPKLTTDGVEKQLSLFKNLVNLKIDKVTNGMFNNICALDLHTLSFRGSYLTALGPLKSLKNLTSLAFSGCGRVKDWNPIGELESVTSLDLTHCNLTDEGLKNISKLKSLRFLAFDLHKITSNVLKDLKEIKSLTFLKISSYFSVKECFDELNSNLISLELYNINITDEGAQKLSNLINLESFKLARCKKITGKGVMEFSKLPKLVSLTISECDGIIPEEINRLKFLKKLRHFDYDKAESMKNMVTSS